MQIPFFKMRSKQIHYHLHPFFTSLLTHSMLKGALVKIDILNKGQKVQHDETKEFESCVFYKLKVYAYCNLSR